MSTDCRQKGDERPRPVDDWDPGRSLLAALAGEAVPLLQRGLDVLLCDGDSRFRVRAADLRLESVPEERHQGIVGFVARHPDAALHVASSWSPNVVAVTAYTDEEIRFVLGILQSEQLMAPGAVGVGLPARTWFFRMPAGVAILDEVLIDNGAISLMGINESAPVFGGPLEFSWDVPMVDPSALPELPAAFLERFSKHFVPVDGQPRFREYGRAGSSYPWWGLTTMLDSAPPGRRWEDDFIASLCHYVAPDPDAKHVCDLVLECDEALAPSVDAGRGFIRRLRELGVPDEAVRIRYSGSKSIHVEVGYRCFGQVPRADGNDVMGRIAERLFADVAKFDRSLFDRRHKARVLGTRHSGTRRCCVPLTVDELFSLTVDDLIERAKRPPAWKPAPASADEPVAQLVKIWRETSDAIEEPAGASGPGRRPQGTRKSTASKGRTGRRASVDLRLARRVLKKLAGHPACITALLGGQRTQQGHRNTVAVALAAYTSTLQMDDFASRKLVRDAAGFISSRNLDRAGIEQRILAARQTARSARSDTYVFAGRSCGALRAAGLPCEVSCPARALWTPLGTRSHRRRPEPIPAGVQVPEPTHYSADDAETMVREHRAGIAALVRSNDENATVDLVIAAPGLGKTTITKKVERKRLAAAPAGERILWLAERHELLETLVADWPNMVHIRPRSAENCPRFAADVKPLVDAGWGATVNSQICWNCPHHPRNADQGRDACAYQRDLRDPACSWACVHHLATLTDVAHRANRIIVDEDLLRACLRKRRYTATQIDLIRREVRATDPEARGPLFRLGEILAAARPAGKDCSGADLAQAFRHADRAQVLRDLEVVLASQLQRCPTEETSHERPARVAPDPRPLFQALQHLLNGRAAPIRWDGNAWLVAWVERPRFFDKPVICLDATADPELLRLVLAREIKVRLFHVPVVAPVLQLADGVYSRRTLFEADGNVRRRTVDRLLRAVAARARLCPGRTLLITFKKLAEGHLSEPAGRGLLPGNVDVKYYGNLRGSDCSQYSQVVLVGFPFHSPADLLLTASALHAGEDPISSATFEEIVPYLATNDWTRPDQNPFDHPGGPAGFRVRRYVDPRLERVRRLHEDGEYWQAINRIRQVSDPTKVTILLSAMPVDPEHQLPVRLVTYEDLVPVSATEGGRASAVEPATVVSDFHSDHAFVSVSAVMQQHPVLAEHVIRRAINKLARRLGLPRLVIRSPGHRGHPESGYGDVEAAAAWPVYAGCAVEKVSRTARLGRARRNLVTPRTSDLLTGIVLEAFQYKGVSKYPDKATGRGTPLVDAQTGKVLTRHPKSATGTGEPA